MAKRWIVCILVLAALGAACSDDSEGAATGDTNDDTTTSAAAGDATTSSTAAGDGTIYPGDEWATAAPEDVGLTQEGLDAMADYLETTDSNCMAVIKDGKLVDE